MRRYSLEGNVRQSRVFHDEISLVCGCEWGAELSHRRRQLAGGEQPASHRPIRTEPVSKECFVPHAPQGAISTHWTGLAPRQKWRYATKTKKTWSRSTSRLRWKQMKMISSSHHWHESYVLIRRKCDNHACFLTHVVSSEVVNEAWDCRLLMKCRFFVTFI